MQAIKIYKLIPTVCHRVALHCRSRRPLAVQCSTVQQGRTGPWLGYRLLALCQSQVSAITSDDNSSQCWYQDDVRRRRCDINIFFQAQAINFTLKCLYMSRNSSEAYFTLKPFIFNVTSLSSHVR